MINSILISSQRCFQTINWVSDVDTASGAFVQWKPICYTNEVKRTQADVSLVRNYDPKQLNTSEHLTSLSASGLAYAYFGNELGAPNQVHIWTANVSFGKPEDKFYANTEYMTWYVPCLPLFYSNLQFDIVTLTLWTPNYFLLNSCRRQINF